MKTKLLAIGNKLMGDDGISLKVAKDIEKQLIDIGINVVFGETDVDYCLNELLDCDKAFILDATCFGIESGSITINEIDTMNFNNKLGLSQHGINLMTLLELYKCHYNVNSEEIKDVYVIGIEVASIEWRLGISKELQPMYDIICKNVLGTIINLI